MRSIVKKKKKQNTVHKLSPFSKDTTWIGQPCSSIQCAWVQPWPVMRPETSTLDLANSQTPCGLGSLKLFRCISDQSVYQIIIAKLIDNNIC